MIRIRLPKSNPISFNDCQLCCLDWSVWWFLCDCHATWFSLQLQEQIDSFLNRALAFLMALPTILGLYRSFACLQLVQIHSHLGCWDWRSYVLPAVILGLLGAPVQLYLIRRYDWLAIQDFVRFGSCKGLSEKEFQNKHIFKKCHGSWFQEFCCCYQIYRWCNLTEQSSFQVWVNVDWLCKSI